MLARPERDAVAQLMEERRAYMGWDVVECRDGRSTIRWTPGPHLTNPIGFVHGGYVAGMIDDTCGTAIVSLLDQVAGFPTINMHVDFVRGIRVGDTVLCKGSVVRMGRRVTVADCVIVPDADDGSESVLARGTCTFALDRPTVVG
jgi:uncharacterized protein (TIGR00369 family)